MVSVREHWNPTPSRQMVEGCHFGHVLFCDVQEVAQFPCAQCSLLLDLGFIHLLLRAAFRSARESNSQLSSQVEHFPAVVVSKKSVRSTSSQRTCYSSVHGNVVCATLLFFLFGFALIATQHSRVSGVISDGREIPHCLVRLPLRPPRDQRSELPLRQFAESHGFDCVVHFQRLAESKASVLTSLTTSWLFGGSLHIGERRGEIHRSCLGQVAVSQTCRPR